MTDYRSTIAKLDEDNYSAWAGKMRSLFMVKQLWATVTGEGDVDVALDEQALGLIGLHVEDHHMRIVLDSATACEAWTAFEDMYKAASHARRMQLKAELHDLQIKSGESVAKYASRVTALRDHLVAAGSTVDEDDLVLSMLGGLTIDFKTVVTIIRSSDNELKLRDVLPKLLQEEQLVNRSDKKYTDSAAFFSERRKQGGRGGGRGDNSRDRSQVECWFCHERGHMKRDCKRMAASMAAPNRTWAESAVAF
jgi:hypothetical protein